MLLFVQIRNTGSQSLRIVDGVVPQDGASRDLTAGGLAAGTSSGATLPPANQTEVFVSLSVRCARVLAGSPAEAILLVAQQPGRHPRLERVSMDQLGSLWDEARHAACRAADPRRDLTAAVVPGSVRATLADDGTLTVSAVMSVHDSAGFAAVLTGAAVSAGGGGRLVVDGGSTRSVPLRWGGGRCAARGRPGAGGEVSVVPGGAARAASAPAAWTSASGSLPRGRPRSGSPAPARARTARAKRRRSRRRADPPAPRARPPGAQCDTHGATPSGVPDP